MALTALTAATAKGRKNQPEISEILNQERLARGRSCGVKTLPTVGEHLLDRE
jgi:hypothetical protein